MIKKFNFLKHFGQLKAGGLLVFYKKIVSLTKIFFYIPFFIISIPLLILIYAIRPWCLIRWQELDSNRIGNFAAITELYCCERDAGINTPSQRCLDLFYLKKYICNKQLEKMWKRQIFILPTWFLFPISLVNRFFCIFFTGLKNHEIHTTTDRDIDVNNLRDKFDAHIKFTPDEEIKGRKILKDFGIPKNAKIICLVVRDSGYLNRQTKHENLNMTEFENRWNYHNYRNGDVDRYILAAEDLANRGYYVFRMGVKVLKPLVSKNPKVIDYANSKIRSDFMDIYLGAKCFFCISTGTGIDAIPFIFRKPIAYIHVPFGLLPTSSEKYLVLTKHHINKKNQKELSVSEIFSSKVAYGLHSSTYENNEVELLENTPEEIRDLAIEMDDKLTGNWIELKDDTLLQKKFWSLFYDNLKKLNCFNRTLHGKMKSKFSTKYLRDNQNWIK